MWSHDFWAIKKLCDALLEEEPLHPDDPDYEYEWPRVDEVMPVPNVDDEYPCTKFISPKDKPSLLPCPACGGEAQYCTHDGVEFEACGVCLMQGPADDPTGSRWNALPRNRMTFYIGVKVQEGIREERQRWIDAVREVIAIATSGDLHDRAWRNGCECLLREMGVTDE